VVLTDWVVAETGNGLARSGARNRFAAVEFIRSSPKAKLVHISEVLQLYTRRSDKDWGLIDCASFAVMEDQGISQACTNDRHFEQAGFTNLLPGPGSVSV